MIGFSAGDEIMTDPVGLCERYFDAVWNGPQEALGVSANMARGGFDPFIPLDEVIEAMADVGRQMPTDWRCTARGGLAVTPIACRATGRHGR